MNRSVEQALASLIPRHNDVLPEELVELASSLLAQSRNKASNLKAEEEIGRTYACANIACERLKISLDLPTIEPRPPCPPRVYKKLYAYFTTLLATNKRNRGLDSSQTNTPNKRRVVSRPTPNKIESLAAYRSSPTEASRMTLSRTRRAGLQYEVPKDIAPWIPLMVRRLCKKLDAPGAIPSVLAGVTSVLTLPSPQTTTRPRFEQSGTEKKDKQAEGSASSDVGDDWRIPGLIAAIFFFVKTRLLGKEMNGKQYAHEKKVAVAILEAARTEGEGADEEEGAKSLRQLAMNKVTRGKGFFSHEEVSSAWTGWEKIGGRDVDRWLKEIAEKGWLELDWFANVVQGAGLAVDREVVESVEEMFDDFDADDGVSPLTDARGLQQKKRIRQPDMTFAWHAQLGSMITPWLDHGNTRSREKLILWKADVSKQIRAMEKCGATDPGRARSFMRGRLR